MAILLLPPLTLVFSGQSLVMVVGANIKDI